MKNILLNVTPIKSNYRAKSGRGTSLRIPNRDRINHGNKLKNQLENILSDYNRLHDERTAASLATIDGVYIQFVGAPDFDLKTSSMEDSKNGIRLLNIKEEITDNQKKISATVFVPYEKANVFLNKIDKYLDPNLPNGAKPRNKDFVESVEDIKQAYLEAFVTTKNTVISNEKKWYEIWLSCYDNNYINSKEEIIRFARRNNIEMITEYLDFSERCVCLMKANKDDLLQMICEVENVAEIRMNSGISNFFLNLDYEEQIEWTNELLERINYPDESHYSIAILDTGLNSNHPLVKPFVLPNGEASYDNSWGTADTPIDYHGTAMAGICIYDSLSSCLSSINTYYINHKIENGKIINVRPNDPHLYGFIVAQTISKLIINNPNYSRVYCMAVTETGECDDGKPSSWSAYLDNICFGNIDQIKKIFMVSAGNYDDIHQLINYPKINKLQSVQSPGQAWNVVTIGGITFKENDNSIAKIGELCPFSRTSTLWSNKWPIKPDVVFEGGNAVIDNNVVLSDSDLSEATTEGDFINRGLLRPFSATSLATAKGSNFAIRLCELYPDYWPETIRALLIHSASWTEQIENQFLTLANKADYKKLLRTCGYGVPSFSKASECQNNYVNMIIQSELKPFKKENSDIKLNEYALFEVLWPKDLLMSNFESDAKIKITLSYYIESNPGELGWKDKYRYASCGLRFSINGQLSKKQFISTITDYINSDDDVNQDRVDYTTGVTWKYGVQARNVGSIHSDIWETTAGVLAESRYIAIYPVAGWWKTKKREKKFDEKIRFSLIISLDVDSDIDIYTEIINQIENQANVETKVTL